jgi:hypothetical protein
MHVRPRSPRLVQVVRYVFFFDPAAAVDPVSWGAAKGAARAVAANEKKSVVEKCMLTGLEGKFGPEEAEDVQKRREGDEQSAYLSYSTLSRQ